MSARVYYLRLIYSGILLCAAVSLSGCIAWQVAQAGFGGAVGTGAGGYLVDATASAIAGALEGTDKANTSFAVKPGASKELTEAKMVAVVLSPSGPVVIEGTDLADDPVKIVEARLSQELIGMGYDVIGRDVLGPEAVDRTPLEAAKEHGADLLVGGDISRSVGADAASRGIFVRTGKAEIETLVKSASVRVTRCKSGTQILNGMISYKKGKPAAVAAADLAIVLKQARGTVPAQAVPVE